MSIKDKITSFLFGSKAQDTPKEELLPEEEYSPQEIQEAQEEIPSDPSLLEVPMEHPIRQLYKLYQSETGTHIPPPPSLYG